MTERHKAKLAAYLVLLRVKLGWTEILLHKRNVGTDFHPGEYALPSGHVEAGESITHAIVREAKEEANIIPIDPRMDHVSYRNENDHFTVDFFFTAYEYIGEIKNNEPDKCIELEWFRINKLPENTAPYIREALKHVLNLYKCDHFSEYGWS